MSYAFIIYKSIIILKSQSTIFLIWNTCWKSTLNGQSHSQQWQSENQTPVLLAVNFFKQLSIFILRKKGLRYDNVVGGGKLSGWLLFEHVIYVLDIIYIYPWDTQGIQGRAYGIISPIFAIFVFWKLHTIDLTGITQFSLAPKVLKLPFKSNWESTNTCQIQDQRTERSKIGALDCRHSRRNKTWQAIAWKLGNLKAKLQPCDFIFRFSDASTFINSHVSILSTNHKGSEN